MIATLVYVDVKPEYIEDFKLITCYNYENTRKEPGNIRFDVLQSNDVPTQFVLYEVFADEEAALKHKSTEHYLKWKNVVAEYMNTPRRASHNTAIAFD